MTLILGFLSLASLIFNIVLFERLKIKILNFNELIGIEKQFGLFIAGAIVVVFIFHIIALVNLVQQFNCFNKESVFRSFIVFLSIVSLLLIFSDVAMLQDIGNEYENGLRTGEEWFILYLNHVIHITFNILLILLLIKIRRTQETTDIVVVKDEAIFINVQYIGVFCGVFALILFLILSLYMEYWMLKRSILVFSFILLLPYLFAAIYWFSKKIKEDINEWYDEKQFYDVTRSSFITLIISIFIMGILYYLNFTRSLNNIFNILWFPVYVFIILLFFSGNILYLYKRK